MQGAPTARDGSRALMRSLLNPLLRCKDCCVFGQARLKEDASDCRPNVSGISTHCMGYNFATDLFLLVVSI